MNGNQAAKSNRGGRCCQPGALPLHSLGVTGKRGAEGEQGRGSARQAQKAHADPDAQVANTYP